MDESTYKIIELVGTSSVSWEEAAKNAVETAARTLKDLRIAEITKLDMKIENGKVVGIDLDHCKGCGICAEECPRKAVSMIEGTLPEAKA